MTDLPWLSLLIVVPLVGAVVVARAWPRGTSTLRRQRNSGTAMPPSGTCPAVLINAKSASPPASMFSTSLSDVGIRCTLTCG